jgi:hypothetical protein
MKRYISILFEGICFGVVFTIFITLKDKLNLNISEKEIIIWSLVIWVVCSVIIRTIMDKINIKKVENQTHINEN